MRELKQNWQDIFHGFRIALDFKKIMLGFVGTVSSVVVVGAILGLFALITNWPNQYGSWLEFLGSFSGVVFMCVAGLGVLAIWSYFGGAICRICAVEFARDERIEMGEATEFAKKKFWSFFWGPTVPGLGILAFVVCIAIGGVVGRIGLGIGPAAVGLFYPLALLGGFLIVLIGIGGVVGCCLMFPTVAVEGTDAFDAISRAFSYVYSRPWQFLWYILVALAYGAACVAFVLGFVHVAASISLSVGEFGMGANNFMFIRQTLDPAKLAFPALAGTQAWVSWGHYVAAVLIGAELLVLFALAAGFAASLDCTMMTIIYYLMRKSVDGTDMTEIYLEEEEEEGLEEPEKEEGGEEPEADAEEGAEEEAEEEEEEEEDEEESDE